MAFLFIYSKDTQSTLAFSLVTSYEAVGDSPLSLLQFPQSVIASAA